MIKGWWGLALDNCYKGYSVSSIKSQWINKGQGSEGDFP